MKREDTGSCPSLDQTPPRGQHGCDDAKSTAAWLNLLPWGSQRPRPEWKGLESHPGLGTHYRRCGLVQNKPGKDLGLPPPAVAMATVMFEPAVQRLQCSAPWREIESAAHRRWWRPGQAHTAQGSFSLAAPPALSWRPPGQPHLYPLLPSGWSRRKQQPESLSPQRDTSRSSTQQLLLSASHKQEMRGQASRICLASSTMPFPGLAFHSECYTSASSSVNGLEDAKISLFYTVCHTFSVIRQVV